MSATSGPGRRRCRNSIRTMLELVPSPLLPRIRVASALLGTGQVREVRELLRAIADDLVRRGRARVQAAETDQLEMRLPMRPDALVTGCPVGCVGITAAGCVARQEANERNSGMRHGTKMRGSGGRSDTAKKRGVSLDHPNCTAACPVGREVRASLTRKE